MTDPATARLGLLSDTHMPKGDYALPPLMLEAFRGVEAILHGGDVTDVKYLEPLGALARVYLVTGNNDPPEMGLRYGWRRALRWRGWRIGLVHGDHGRGRSTPQRARNAFRAPPPSWEEVPTHNERPPPLPRMRVAVPEKRPTQATVQQAVNGPFDCIVFGHSHIPFCGLMEGVLMINPGSPTERRREPRASFALLETTEDGTLQARMMYL